MKSSRLSWTARSDEGVVRLTGDIDEDANFGELVKLLAASGASRLNLRGVVRINSIGVREWVNFIREASGASKLVLEECSPVVVAQLNMIANFAGTAVVSSILAPYLCEECGHEEQVLLEVSSIDEDAPLATRPCPKCDENMELDDLPESYFAFAKQ